MKLYDTIRYDTPRRHDDTKCCAIRYAQKYGWYVSFGIVSYRIVVCRAILITTLNISQMILSSSKAIQNIHLWIFQCQMFYLESGGRDAQLRLFDCDTSSILHLTPTVKVKVAWLKQSTVCQREIWQSEREDVWSATTKWKGLWNKGTDTQLTNGNSYTVLSCGGNTSVHKWKNLKKVTVTCPRGPVCLYRHSRLRGTQTVWGRQTENRRAERDTV